MITVSVWLDVSAACVTSDFLITVALNPSQVFIISPILNLIGEQITLYDEKPEVEIAATVRFTHSHPLNTQSCYGRLYKLYFILL